MTNQTDPDDGELDKKSSRIVVRLVIGALASFGLFAMFIPLNEVIAIAILFGMIAAAFLVFGWVASRIEWNWNTMMIVHVIGLVSALAIRGCVNQ